jgi:hypothetical protein
VDQTPIPLAIFNSAVNQQEVGYVPFSNDLKINGLLYEKYSTKPPRTQNSTLWFRTFNKDANPSKENYDPKYPLWIANRIENSTNLTLTGKRPTEQPLLVPVLQIQYSFIKQTDSSTLNENRDVKNSGNWMQTATNTETNLIFAQGNTPGRPNETNGGLENFVRYLERWEGINHRVAGSFIQFKRSSYATAPWQVLTSTGYSNSETIFGYPQGYRLTVTNASGQTLGRTPFFTPPNRYWSYDTALLSQLPDLFAQRFTTPSTKQPSEFYREVGRDDAWVKTLLCAAQNGNVGGYENAPSEYGSNFKYAVSQDQRRACP